MLHFFTHLFDTTDFPPRWYCGNWSSGHGWLHICSDLGTFAAYMAIPMVLAYFVIRRKDVPFPKLFWLFAAFIFSCGTVHLVEAMIFWTPIYRFSGFMKFTTAAVSWAAVIALVPITPGLLALPSPQELEKEIQERKSAEQKLRHYAAELERSNLELQRFAYVASHDLKEPLRSVGSYCQLLQRHYHGKLDEDADKWIDFAVEGAQRMQSLVEGLLTYSRVESRSKPYEQVDCEAVFARATESLMSSIDDTGAKVTHSPLPTLMADGLQLGQLFQNLISNAIKYHGSEPPRIHISAQLQGDGWRFAVKDNGIGIRPDHQEKIFEVFQRLHRHDEYPGTGIGLAVCKRIVERHRGRIWVESKVGEGSTFFFTLPQETPQGDSAA